MPVVKFTYRENAQEAKDKAEEAFKAIREKPLSKLSLNGLIEAGALETGTGVYFTVRQGDGAVLETQTIEGADPLRYREICELIAVKLIHASSDEQRKLFHDKITDSQGDPVDLEKIQSDVYKIISSKFEKSMDILSELESAYTKGKKEDKAWTVPLNDALYTGPGDYAADHGLSILKTPPEVKLEALCKYQKTLFDSNKGPSIAQQMKDSGDHMVVRILKGILFTLLSLGGYGIYGIVQAVRGGSHAGIDNPAEQFLQSAGRELFSERERRHTTMKEEAKAEPQTTARPEAAGDESEEEDAPKGGPAAGPGGPGGR